MSKLKPAFTEDEIKRKGVADVRKAYNNLAAEYNRILDGKIYYCHCCNEFHLADCFYSDKRYASGLFPECKQALLEQATDYDKETKEYKDNKEKTIEVMRKLNLPFIDSLYKSALTSTQVEEGEKNRRTAFQHMITMVKSLPQYRKLTFENSEFDAEYIKSTEEEGKVTMKAVKAGKKIFGLGFSNEDYTFLMNQYDDFCTRTQVDSISQETYVKQICLQLLDIDKDRKDGKDVSKKIDSLDKLMNSANLQPKQNVGNAATDSLTFGQLIEKWEIEKPIPEPDPEFKDINGIGKLLRVYFAGHLSRALGLKNSYSQEYEEELKKFTVEPPKYREDITSDTYQQLFGSEEI